MNDFQSNKDLKNKVLIAVLIGVIFALIGYIQKPYSYVCNDNPPKQDYLDCVSDIKEGWSSYADDKMLRICNCDNIEKRKDGVLSAMFLGALLGPTMYAVFLTLKDG